MTHGTAYDISFYLHNDGTVPNTFQVTVDGFFAVFQISQPANGYERYEFTHAAFIDQTVPIDFYFYQPNGSFFLDDASVTAIPENATTLGLLCASALLLFLAKNNLRG